MEGRREGVDCHSSSIREHHSTVLGSGRGGEVGEYIDHSDTRCMRRERREESTHHCAWKWERGEAWEHRSQ